MFQYGVQSRESGVRSLVSGVRSPESRGESRHILERLQKALWRCLGRLQEVLKDLYQDSQDFVMILRLFCCWNSPGTSIEAGGSRKIAVQGESGVWRRVQKRSWDVPRDSVALPETSRKAAGGFGRVLARF